MMKRSFTYITEEKYIGRSIKEVLKNKLLMSSALITDLKKSEYGITVNCEPKFVNYILKTGDVLEILIEEGGSENINPVFSELDILYEDEDFLAVNKPRGMPTHTSAGHHEDTLANAVLYYLNRNGEEHTFHAVTRLDKDTTGVVLIAKNRYAHDLISRQLIKRQAEKTYAAIVCGRIFGEGIINKKIRRLNDSIIKRTVADDGSEAITHYRSIKVFDEHTLVELKPKTGRTHQLRVHMAYIGYPLVGDGLYGGADGSEDGHLLHCRELCFIHPIKKEKIEISAALPESFKAFF